MKRRSTAVAAAARCERHNDGTRRRATRNEVSEERGVLYAGEEDYLCCYRFTAGVPEAAPLLSQTAVGIRGAARHTTTGGGSHDATPEK